MNTFGRSFRITTFGESHGTAIGAVVDGCPPGVFLSPADIQPFLDRRRPGSSDLVTPRRESDLVEILSGVFEGQTLGTPIALLIKSETARSSDYDQLRDLYRPGHADRTYYEKYGIRDHRGGGRSSGRETAGRVAAGAVASICLKTRGISVIGKIIEIHGNCDPATFEHEIRDARDRGDSVGGVISLTITGCPAGLGDPVFGKLDALLAAALMSIGGVKGIEIGSGFAGARMYGSEHNDPMSPEGYLSNNAGGILGGISSGQDILVRLAVKPTPSICILQSTIDQSGNPRSIVVGGRHDPCIALRIVPVAEAMAALVLMDALLEQDTYAAWKPNRTGTDN
ncbi:MAG: chorismate synthase [Methanospirillum sp.]|uniref:chorismate synthase n=1 Tax=Methanospirillum sp. TaxID=45200 RepID=UPI00236C5CDE|nr:chorismate synthase [Methanospirillum sp.]MDD1730499.1 chorismate synthase [Methanospirillum sp.]